MGRPTLHPRETMIRSAQRLAAAASTAEVTIAAVARDTGAPVGTIYHRFGSRDGLLAEAWLDALAAYQAGFLAALRPGGRPPGGPAALWTTAWARQEAVRARLLVLRGPRDFGAERWAGPARERGQRLAAELEQGLDDFCRRHLGATGGEHRRLATFALLDLPQAAVRRYLAVGMAPPESVDGYLLTALTALLPGTARN